MYRDDCFINESEVLDKPPFSIGLWDAQNGSVARAVTRSYQALGLKIVYYSL